MHTILWIALLGCGNDIGISESARCDGELQGGEDEVDDAFDGDGDGYFDDANPDCRATYDPEDLDCDDGDPDVRPGTVETTCNGLDDDCDPETSDLDERDCVESYSGTWTLDRTVRYGCALGNVNIDFDSLLVQDNAPDISLTSIGAGSQPSTMVGTLAGAAFEVERVVSGGCTETYRLLGTFESPTRFTATFTADYAGGSLNCLDCTSRSWELEGSL